MTLERQHESERSIQRIREIVLSRDSKDTSIAVYRRDGMWLSKTGSIQVGDLLAVLELAERSHG